MLTLVTGATGLVGNNVVRLLLERGEGVRVMERETSDRRPLAGLDVEVVRGDVRDRDSVIRACTGVNRVVHAAARVHIGWTGLELQQAVNTQGTEHVAQAARQAGARLIHVSTVDSLGSGTRQAPATEDALPDDAPACPYLVTKRLAEQRVLAEVERGLDAVIVNPGYMLGPWDWKPSSGRMLLAVSRGRLWFAPPGGNDFCDVRDVAAGILAAGQLGATGRRYILGGHPMSYFDAWRTFAQVTGARPPRWVVGPHLLRLAGLAGSAWGRVIGREPDVNTAATAIAATAHHFCSSRARAELGYSPRSVIEAAQAAWEWFQTHGYR